MNAAARTESHLVWPLLCSVLVLVSVAFECVASDDGEKPHKVTDAKLGNTRNVHACGKLFLAGQPSPDDIAVLKEKGIQRVITLRTDGEVDWDEAGKVKQAGIEFVKIPFGRPDSLTDQVFDKVRKALKDHQKPTLLHCGSANRVGAVWLTYRVLDEGVPVDQAIKEAKRVGLRSSAYLQKALDYIRRHSKG